jgi:hypothetical protein
MGFAAFGAARWVGLSLRSPRNDGVGVIASLPSASAPLPPVSSPAREARKGT